MASVQTLHGVGLSEALLLWYLPKLLTGIVQACVPYPLCFWVSRHLQPEPQAALRLKVFGDLDCHLSAFGRGVSWIGPELCYFIARGTQPRKEEPVLSVFLRDNGK